MRILGFCNGGTRPPNNAQHDHHDVVLSTLHVHLDRHGCLEVVVLRGPGRKVKALGDKLVSTRGVKHGKVTLTTTGRALS